MQWKVGEEASKSPQAWSQSFFLLRFLLAPFTGPRFPVKKKGCKKIRLWLEAELETGLTSTCGWWLEPVRKMRHRMKKGENQGGKRSLAHSSHMARVGFPATCSHPTSSPAVSCPCL